MTLCIPRFLLLAADHQPRATLLTSTHWQFVALLAGTASALVGAPLTAILFYLRAIRDDQRIRQQYLDTRLETLAADLRRVESAIDHIEKNYTTREDWSRETMLARQQLERLSEWMAKIDAGLEQSHGLATQFVRATNAIIALAERLSERLPPATT